MKFRKINLDGKASEAGFRNFTSFAFVYYYGKKNPLQTCASMIDISYSTMRKALIEKCWPIRVQSQVPRGAPKKKRSVDVLGRIKANTSFNSVEEALRVCYEEYSLNAYEISATIKISAPLVYKLLRKHGIKVRKSGGAIDERSS